MVDGWEYVGGRGAKQAKVLYSLLLLGTYILNRCSFWSAKSTDIDKGAHGVDGLIGH